MTTTQTKLISFDEFIEWYPENSEYRYELHDGVILQMPKATGKHSKVTGFLIEEINITNREIGKRGVWFIPKECIVKSSSEKSGYEPDIIVLTEENIGNERRWEKESIIEEANSVKLIVEVVSTNWRDDYFKKRADYEEMGIPEYWIVDYAALGGRNFIGNPKQPTFFVYWLVEGEYKVTQFRGDELIQSPTFPNFNLTAQQVFNPYST
ncbi:MAG: Uma2 family endonuclease [Calothrix sp. MO_192.B10]|nr:Uma2 family endonuclease [Calothrix sp. MO_192.B10]